MLHYIAMAAPAAPMPPPLDIHFMLHYIAAIIVREDNNLSLFTVHILSFLCRFVLLAPYSNDPCCK